MDRTLRMHTDEKVLNLRPRNEGKELAGTFRFKPVDTSERIADALASYHGIKMPKQYRQDRSRSPVNISIDEGSLMQDSIISDSKSRTAGSVDRGSSMVGKINGKPLKARHESVPFNRSKY